MATKPDNSALKDGLKAVWKSGQAARRDARPSPESLQPAAATSGNAQECEDLALFRMAVADVKPLPPDNRAQPGPIPSRRQPLRKTTEKNSHPGSPARPPGIDLPEHWQHAGLPTPLPRDPEQAALHLAMSGVQPLPELNLALPETPRPPPRPRQSAADRQAVLHESLHAPISLQDRLEGGDEAHYLRDGIAAGVLRDLRRGRWVIQDEIDLHGQNRDEARSALAVFLAACLLRGLRCIRVIHGKGLGSPQKLSILRQLVRGWLAQRQEVLAYCQAKPADGGEGALLVLLRSTKKQGAA